VFKKDIEDLKSKGIILVQNNLRQLDLFIDDENIVRVGGRFLTYNRTLSTHIYCINNHLTRFIIEHEHQKLMHVEIKAILAAIRLKYWLFKARRAVRKLLRSYIRCFKHRPRFPEQLMGNLPKRIRPSRPFSA